MKVSRLSWTPFRLPLRVPFRTAAGEIADREGLVLRIATDAGLVGLGEASPHPDRGPDALREVEESLTRVAPRLLGAEVSCLDELVEGLPPALACAIDTAACDALARARSVSVARLLSETARTSVPVNATIATADETEAVAQATTARKAGFDCVKLKVGMARDLDEERRRVAAVRATLGSEVRLRLDANGAWSMAQAVAAIQALEEYDLEFVEQPVRAGEVEAMKRVRREVATPIAADEESLAGAWRVLELEAAQVLVVKPMVVGGLRPARELIQRALEAGVAAIVTTTIDAGVGAAAALHLAATLPPDSPACGLATGALLADDIVERPLEARAGRMVAPDSPGLGVEIDEAKLARYGSGEREVG